MDRTSEINLNLDWIEKNLKHHHDYVLRCRHAQGACVAEIEIPDRYIGRDNMWIDDPMNFFCVPGSKFQDRGEYIEEALEELNHFLMASVMPEPPPFQPGNRALLEKVAAIMGGTSSALDYHLKAGGGAIITSVREAGEFSLSRPAQYRCQLDRKFAGQPIRQVSFGRTVLEAIHASFLAPKVAGT
jgi:hypothetical protein